MLSQIMAVAAGGALGALTRFAIVVAPGTPHGSLATLTVNLAGSFLIGLLFAKAPTDGGLYAFLGIGFLGSFTTVSTYSAETLAMLRAHAWLPAVGNIMANGLGGPIMAVLGWRISLLWGA